MSQILTSNRNHQYHYRTARPLLSNNEGPHNPHPNYDLLRELDPFYKPPQNDVGAPMLSNMVDHGNVRQLALPALNSSNDFRSRNSFCYRNVNMNLSFDGSRNALPIERFLFRVERLAVSFNIPSEQLVDELHFLLKGSAMEFYWSVVEQHRGRITWAQMKIALRERYRERRTDFDIRRAID